MGKNENKYRDFFPPIIVCVGYRDICDDYETVKIKEILKDIPTAAIINFIAENINSILYSFSDTKTQRQLIRDFCPYVATEVKKKNMEFYT